MTLCNELQVAVWVVGIACGLFGQQQCRALTADGSIGNRRLVEQSTLAVASLVPHIVAVYLALWY